MNEDSWEMIRLELKVMGRIDFTPDFL